MPCERVVVQELQQILAAAQGKPDEKFAEQLAWLQLSERVSATRLSRWKAQLPGPESRQALTALADVAKFLDLQPRNYLTKQHRIPARRYREQCLAHEPRYSPDSVNPKSLHLPYRHCTVIVTGVFKALPQLSQA